MEWMVYSAGTVNDVGEMNKCGHPQFRLPDTPGPGVGGVLRVRETSGETEGGARSWAT
jgi:hypothetical protein